MDTSKSEGSNSARLGSRTTRKKKTSRGRSVSISVRAAVQALFLLLLLGLAAVLGFTAFFLAGMDDEGIIARVPKSGERLNILIMGIDGGVLEGGSHMIGRSDVLLLVSLNPETHTAMLLSIPRDTLVNLPDVGESKINAAHVFGGSELTIAVVEKLLSQPVHYFVKLDYSGFKAIVDAAGGVTLDVEQEMQYTDPYDDPPLVIDLRPGFQHLDGEKAEQYVRFRGAAGDIGRVAQQKKLLLALAQQLSNPLNIWRLPGTAQKAQEYLTGNLTFNDLLRCGWLYLSLSGEPKSETLPGEGTYDGSYWLADYQGIQTLFSTEAESEPKADGGGWFNFDSVLDRMGSVFKEAPKKEEILLLVLNGNGGPGTATRAAENFKREKYQVVDVDEADNYEYLKSVIIYNKDAEDKAKVMLGSLPGALLRAAEEDHPSCDLVVIIGRENVR